MKKGNFVAALAFAAIAGYVIWEASGFPPGRAKVPGAAMFPTIVATVMLLACASLVITTLRMRPQADTPLGLLSGDNTRVYISMAIMIAYFFIMPKVGFVTTSSVLLFILIQWFGKYKPYFSAAVAVATAGLIYGVFNYVLHVPFRFGALL